MDAPRDGAGFAYNMKAMVEATGIRAETLRSWERRFQILRPLRTDSGYRKYSLQDVQTVRWLRARLAEGFTIGRAIELMRAAGDQAALRATPQTTGAVCRDLIAACRNLDETAADHALAGALTIASPEQVCLAVMAPALAALGEHGVANPGEMGPAHFASVVIRARLLSLYSWAGRGSPNAPALLLAGAPGETHDLGLLMVALFARRAGMRTTFLGVGANAPTVKETVKQCRPAIVCLSASAPDTACRALDLASSLATLADGSPPAIVLGGGGVAAASAPLERVHFAPGDAAQALRVFSGLVPGALAAG